MHAADNPGLKSLVFDMWCNTAATRVSPHTSPSNHHEPALSKARISIIGCLWFYNLQFQRDGFAVLRDFISDKEIQDMKQECQDLVNEMDYRDHRAIFSTTTQVVTSI